MTSMQKAYSQIPYKSRLFVAVLSGNGFTQAALDTAITASTRIIKNGGSMLNTTDATAFVNGVAKRAFTGTDVGPTNMFRSLGKELRILTNGRTDYILTYVQNINGLASEGVPSNYASATLGNFWICTWIADGVAPALTVGVARLG